MPGSDTRAAVGSSSLIPVLLRLDGIPASAYWHNRYTRKSGVPFEPVKNYCNHCVRASRRAPGAPQHEESSLMALGKFLILRRPRGGRLEGRTAPIQRDANSSHALSLDGKVLPGPYQAFGSDLT